jgi:hypothetical protein
MQPSQAFLVWADEQDYWYARYSVLADLIQEFLLQHILTHQQFASLVARRLWDVLNRCDELTYDEPGTAEAYALLHLLDRYHRFQLISKTLIESGILPIRRRDINILDVGSGPGPAMYALSDTYTMLSQFGSEQGVPVLKNLRWYSDYVERSGAFREWLHHFTEFLLNARPDLTWHVPFHHGTFRNFENIDFDIVRENLQYDDDGDDYREQYIEKHRFDLIVVSNFLTRVDQVTELASQLQRCVRALRNRGVLVIVGARAANKQYADVYDKLSQVIETGKYSNWKLVASCRRINIHPPVLRYSYRDRYGVRLKQLYTTILTRFESLQVADQIPTAALDAMKATISPQYDKKIEWELHVFKKHSRVRPQHKRRS